MPGAATLACSWRLPAGGVRIRRGRGWAPATRPLSGGRGGRECGVPRPPSLLSNCPRPPRCPHRPLFAGRPQVGQPCVCSRSPRPDSRAKRPEGGASGGTESAAGPAFKSAWKPVPRHSASGGCCWALSGGPGGGDARSPAREGGCRPRAAPQACARRPGCRPRGPGQLCSSPAEEPFSSRARLFLFPFLKEKPSRSFSRISKFPTA